MRKIYFVFGIHNHQPVGNFPEVLEQAYRESYWPFMEVMSRHPRVKWCLHCTGILWDFLKEKHPEYMEAVRKMVKSGQVELLTGGYYEPIMAAIPDRDKKGQITKLTKFLKKEFDYNASGMWMAERVWEPQLAKPFAEAGVEFTVLDDAHFAAAGADVDKLRGYYVTEEQGTQLSVFPISQHLRYCIPFATVEKTLEFFSANAREEGNPLLVMADDGEKFGMWPETFKHVYEHRWLDNFLTAVENSSEWLIPTTFSEYRTQFSAEGRVYLPTASYFEMSQWSLPAVTQQEFDNVVRQFEHQPHVNRFLRGGFWRNFLTKYPESNTMHKKMLHVSEKLNQGSVDATILDSLYAGQCNCAYWHGVFGGLYLPHLRSAVYERLLQAERQQRKKGMAPQLSLVDFDRDGRNEVLFESDEQNLYFAPSQGGALFEWDIVQKNRNLGNVLTRRFESYHQKLREYIAQYGGDGTWHGGVKLKEKNLDHYLHYDWYRRASLLDHFIHPETGWENFRRCQFGEQGDFVLGEYDAQIEGTTVTMRRTGRVWVGDKAVRISITKRIVPQECGMTVFYELHNHENCDTYVHFVPEFNFGFCYAVDADTANMSHVHEWCRRDDGFDLEVVMQFSHAIDLWAFPVETVSLSEGGFERTYQGTSVAPILRTGISAGGTVAFKITLAVK